MAISPAVDVLTTSQQERRQRVVRAALELANDGGYDAVQMRDVAATAQVALGTVYRYFASKDHLLAAGLLDWAEDLRRRIEQLPIAGDTPADRTVDVLRRVTRASARKPRLFAALVTAISAPDPAVTDCQAEVATIVASILERPLDGLDEELRTGVVRVLSHVWFSALVGWVNGWSNVGQVGDELELTARLLLRDL